MTSRGLNVDGYDISEKAVQRALYHEVIRKKAATFEGYDYYIICISTHKPDDISTPYLDGIYQIAHQLSYEGKTGAHVGIESTITKGTSDKVNEILRHKLHVSHFPHRFYIKETAEHGVRQRRVLGGCEPCCIDQARHFYGDLLDIPLHIVSSIEVAELTKIVENSYRFVEIAFAEELKILCDRYGIDFDELRKAVNTKWNIEILEAQKGIGGHCLPKDSQMLLNMSRNALGVSIVETAKTIDQMYRRCISNQVTRRTSLATEVETG
jgi:UDP-N-acetyl-D-mannosaminuronic acid dehydrogenase